MKRGFSLVELSIVLVILGLLTGGIMAGQSLIRSAETKAVINEHEKYLNATKMFIEKYDAIPGDMANATDVWGAQDPTPATCKTSASTGVATCNGNDNRVIDDPAGSDEQLRFWQQLANAGFIEGKYDGVNFLTSSPYSKLGSNAVWSTLYVPLAGDADTYAIDYGNFFHIHSANMANLYVLTPGEAWNIDTKIDDGKPAYGTVIARFWNNICASADDGTPANNDLAASYRLTDNTKRCTLHFVQQY